MTTFFAKLTPVHQVPPADPQEDRSIIRLAPLGDAKPLPHEELELHPAQRPPDLTLLEAREKRSYALPKATPKGPFYVYRVTHTLTGRVYIGQTVSPSTRWKVHATSSDRTHLHNAIRKHGPETFTFQVLEELPSQEAVNDAEQRLIAAHDSTNPSKGFNIQHGGQYAQARRPGKLSYEEARAYCHAQGITSVKAYNALSDRRLYKAPSQAYHGTWSGWSDFLGVPTSTAGRRLGSKTKQPKPNRHVQRLLDEAHGELSYALVNGATTPIIRIRPLPPKEG